MDESLISKIDKRLEELRTNRTAASKKAGLGGTFIRDLARKGANPSIENLRKLAEALQIPLEELTNSQIASNDNESVREADLGTLPVVGIIEAGQFRDITLMDQDEEFETINVARDPRFPRARQYALKVNGDSMNELFADGSYVTAVDFWDSGLDPKDGLIVHVERRIADTHLVETTLKQIKRDGAVVMLQPRSTNPKHKPIPMEGEKGSEIVIRGVITGKWEPMRI